jgi:hypothetical protein
MDALHLVIWERLVYWKMRAKVRFSLEGDDNTKFFHASATYRLRRNSIPSLVIDAVTSSSHLEKASILKNYYIDLLGTARVCAWHFNLAELYPPGTGLPSSLSDAFFPKEIKKAFLDMNNQSSPGTDGFGPSFFSTFWDLVSADITQVFSAFFDGTIDLTRINRAFLVLLPKCDAASHPS